MSYGYSSNNNNNNNNNMSAEPRYAFNNSSGNIHGPHQQNINRGGPAFPNPPFRNANVNQNDGVELERLKRIIRSALNIAINDAIQRNRNPFVNQNPTAPEPTLEIERKDPERRNDYSPEQLETPEQEGRGSEPNIENEFRNRNITAAASDSDFPQNIESEAAETEDRNGTTPHDIIEIGSERSDDRKDEETNNIVQGAPHRPQADRQPIGSSPPQYYSYVVSATEPTQPPPPGRFHNATHSRSRPAPNLSATREKPEATSEKSAPRTQNPRQAARNMEKFQTRIRQAENKMLQIMNEAEIPLEDKRIFLELMRTTVFDSVKGFLEFGTDETEWIDVFEEKLTESTEATMKDVEKYFLYIKSLDAILQRELNSAKDKLNAALAKTSAPGSLSAYLCDEIKSEATHIINAKIAEKDDFRVEDIVRGIIAKKLEKYVMMIGYFK